MWRAMNSWQRRFLGVSLVVGLASVVQAPPAAADGGVSVRVGIGHHGHGHAYRPYSYRPYYRPYSYRPYSYRPYYRPYSYRYSHRPYSYRSYSYYHHDRPGYHGHYGPYSGSRYDGALDLNVRPKDAEVYVDGEYVGTVGEYDGWPRYLWLEEGSYELILYREGYETVVRDVAVRPDRVVNLKLRLREGPSTPVVEATRYPEGDTRERSERRYRSEGDDAYGDPGGTGDREPIRDDDRYPESRSAERRGGSAPEARSSDELDLTEPGRVHLVISPAEAAVYLDGRFVGIAAELSELAGGLLMDPGEHQVQIVHPGYRTLERAFAVEADAVTQLELELEP